MPPHDRWLATLWPFVRANLPPPAEPAQSAPPEVTVVEIGCGPLGGFVPEMRAAGYAATGVDPKAPEGPDYRQVEFETYLVPEPVDAIVACTSLHHVADLDVVLDHVRESVRRGGALIVVEWAWERFDEKSARWCFERLTAPDPADEPGWLHRHRERWTESGLSWRDYLLGWVAEEKLHRSEDIVRALDARFAQREMAYTPYFFSDLAGVSPAEEQAAIDAGEIAATGIRYVATNEGDR
jgi:SAM-dependent methyltransferase